MNQNSLFFTGATLSKMLQNESKFLFKTWGANDPLKMHGGGLLRLVSTVKLRSEPDFEGTQNFDFASFFRKTFTSKPSSSEQIIGEICFTY